MIEASCDELQGYLFSKPVPSEALSSVDKQTREKWEKRKQRRDLMN
jgi:EAL domain-containing protein (putative c-di-GMP-specific phosphodiesterase class I)